MIDAARLAADSSAAVLPTSESPLSVLVLHSCSCPSVSLDPVGGLHWYAGGWLGGVCGPGFAVEG